jgi:hypothetical protein
MLMVQQMLLVHMTQLPSAAHDLHMHTMPQVLIETHKVQRVLLVHLAQL